MAITGITLSMSAETYLHSVIDNAPMGIATVDIDGVLLQVNPAYCQITGYDKEELEGTNYKKVSMEEDLPIDRYNVQQLLTGKVNSYRLEKRYVRKDGKIIWVQVTRSLLRDDKEKPLFFIAQVEDITARKESEKALQASENRFRNIVDNAPVGILTLSTDGQIFQVNPAYCHITGYDKEELENMNYKTLNYVEDRAIDTAKVQQLLEGKIQSYNLEKRYVRKDGKVIWVEVIRSIVRSLDTGNPLYFIAQVEDITDRKQMEKTLRESEERFRNIMDNAPVGIATLTIDGQFIQVNPELCKITGYDKSELAALTYQELTFREDLPKNIAQIQDLLTGKISHGQIEKRYVRKDGKIIWVQVTRSILRDKNTGVSLYFIAQVEDISERKLLEKKLQKSAEEIADLYENAPCAYHSLDANGVFIRMNATELQWLGYMRNEVIGKMKFLDLLTPASQIVFQENLKQFTEQGFLNDLEVEMHRKDGSTFTVLLSATGNKLGDRYAMSRSTMFNITDRKRTEKALQESEARFRNIMDNAPIGMATQSLEDKFLLVNNALLEITGYKKEELKKIKFQDLTHPEDLASDIANMRRLLEGKVHHYQMEKRIFRKDGSVSWVEITRSILRDDLSGEPLYFIVQVEDINERIQNRDEIRHIAYHDKLTGLPNRHSLQELVKKTLAEAKRHKQIFAIMFLDLDKFKHINDTLGHDAGDELLKEVTARLNKFIRSSDFIARTGGDEFIIVLTELPSPQDAAVTADKILKIINQPLTIHNQSLQIAASIGIVTYPENGEDIIELMKNADMAMYKAKEAGGNQYHFY